MKNPILIVVSAMLSFGYGVNKSASTGVETYKFPPLTEEICKSREGSWDLSTGEPQCIISYLSAR